MRSSAMIARRISASDGSLLGFAGARFRGSGGIWSNSRTGTPASAAYSASDF